jgi:hypothetical protein
MLHYEETSSSSQNLELPVRTIWDGVYDIKANLISSLEIQNYDDDFIITTRKENITYNEYGQMLGYAQTMTSDYGWKEIVVTDTRSGQTYDEEGRLIGYVNIN